jgi:hypothetical protein
MWPRARDRATQYHDGYTGLVETAATFNLLVQAAIHLYVAYICSARICHNNSQPKI